MAPSPAGEQMRFEILGPLRVGGGGTTVTAGRDRTVLAMLLLRHGRVVPADELVDAIWGDRPPATARTQLQICVSRLRQRLTALGLPPEMIVTDAGGYGIRVGPDDLDAALFSREVEAARAALATGRTDDAVRWYRTALARWRGPALGGIPSDAVRRRAQTLDEQRLTALEEYVDVELRLGHAAELLDELTESVERNPLRDRLRGQLMLALSTLGRQADALTVYREGRQIYADELGIEPGALLQEVHQRILAGDLTGPAVQRPAAGPVRALPRTISDFTGRQEMIDRLLKEDGARVQLIDGMAGSGKTALAVHLATRLADRYPDAQLFIDLHGYSERTPLSPSAALATLLRQLGVPADRIPVDPEDRIALWRTELAGRRALVLLDNAASPDQVAPLLPSGPQCLTLITSRRRLVGLDESRPSSLPVLDAEEAVELLGRVAGADRVTAEREAAAEVVRRCGYLPLAIRLAGARLAHRPGWRIADLAQRLAGARDPLAELAAGQRSVGAAFALSHAQVSPAAQRLFRLLGLHPGARFDNRVAAALAELALPDAQELLDELVDAHLLEEPEPGRFRLHDLIREYARRLLTDGDDHERRGGLERLLDHHLHVAATIARSTETSANRRIFTLPDPLRPDLVEACATQGLAWFDENLAALTALTLTARDEGFPRHCWQLARACWRVNYMGGHLDELIETHRAGLEAAETLDDPVAVALTLNYLASAYYRLAQFPEAIQLLERALDVCGRAGLRRQLLNFLWNLGLSYTSNGDHQQGRRHFDEALLLINGRHDRDALAELLSNYSFALATLGRYEEALRLSRLHLSLARELGDLRQLANAVGHTAIIRQRMGHAAPARRLLRAALRLKRVTGNRYGEGEVLNELGVLTRREGRPEEAAELHRQAFVVISESGDRIGQCASRNLLALAILDQGDVPSALDLFRRVLHDATRIAHRYEQARALDGIARCLRTSDPAAARSHWIRASALFRQLDVPEQHEVQRLLADLD